MSLRTALAALCAAPALAFAQSPSPAPAPVPAVTRADLAAAYQRVDARLMSHPVDSTALVAANRRFDQATLSFFAGRNADAVRALNRLYGELLGDTASDGAVVRAAGLRLEATPRILVRGQSDGAIALVPVYPLGGKTPLEVDVRLLDARGRTAARSRASIEPARAASVSLDVPARNLARLPAGRYRAVAVPGGTSHEILIGTLDVAAEAPDAMRARLTDASATLDSTRNPHSYSAFRARLANLVSVPNVDQSAQFLSDPTALSAALDRELAALRDGRDPYTATGDVWRTIVGAGGRPLPMRVIVPGTASSATPWPVVIALHGAGGDENMFPDAYGTGEVVRQAAQHGAIVVSPATVVFQRDPAMLDSVLAVVSRAYAIDSARVFVVGQSMGAAAAYAVGVARPWRIAASVLLNGAGRAPAPGSTTPRSLWIAGGIDPVIPAARVRMAADAARAAGANVEYRERMTAGHTLGVGTMLPEAFAFLFNSRPTSP